MNAEGAVLAKDAEFWFLTTRHGRSAKLGRGLLRILKEQREELAKARDILEGLAGAVEAHNEGIGDYGECPGGMYPERALAFLAETEGRLTDAFFMKVARAVGKKA